MYAPRSPAARMQRGHPRRFERNVRAHGWEPRSPAGADGLRGGAAPGRPPASGRAAAPAGPLAGRGSPSRPRRPYRDLRGPRHRLSSHPRQDARSCRGTAPHTEQRSAQSEMTDAGENVVIPGTEVDDLAEHLGGSDEQQVRTGRFFARGPRPRAGVGRPRGGGRLPPPPSRGGSGRGCADAENTAVPRRNPPRMGGDRRNRARIWASPPPGRGPLVIAAVRPAPDRFPAPRPPSRRRTRRRSATWTRTTTTRPPRTTTPRRP